MARKKRGDQVRTLTKVAGGRSLCVTLPISLMRELNWNPQKKVCVRKWGKRVIIEDMDELESEGRKCVRQ